MGPLRQACPAWLARADHVWHLDDGQIVEHDPPHNILATASPTTRFFGRQPASLASRNRATMLPAHAAVPIRAALTRPKTFGDNRRTAIQPELRGFGVICPMPGRREFLVCSIRE